MDMIDKKLLVIIFSTFLILTGCQNAQLADDSVYSASGDTVDQITAEQEQSPYKQYLVKRNTFIRINDDATSEILLKISEGEILFAIVDEQDKGWYQIHTLEGVRGYIFGEPLKLQD